MPILRIPLSIAAKMGSACVWERWSPRFIRVVLNALEALQWMKCRCLSTLESRLRSWRFDPRYGWNRSTSEMFETACPIARKVLWLRIDRKLSTILLSSRIDASADKNDVIKRCTKVKDDLADQEQPARRFRPHIPEEFVQSALNLVRGRFVLRESGI